MDPLQFLQSVKLMAGVDRDGAHRAAEVTLATLAERLGRPGADELARAVLATLKEDVAAVDRLRDRLPPDYRYLFA